MQIKELVEEKLILAKIANSDQYAFNILYDFYRNKVYSYALHLLQSEELSQEIVQEVFIKIWLKRGTLITVENFGGFLRVIAKNETLNALKKSALEQKKYTQSHENWSEADMDTQNSIQYRETKALVDQAIQKLPRQQQIVYTLCQVQGLKQKDVAEQLNISPLTVKVHLREAIKSIRIFLSQNGDVLIFFLILTTPF